MKKMLSVLCLMLVLTLVSATAAQALMSLSGHYGSFNGSSGSKTGFGGELSLPLLPLTLGATYLAHNWGSLSYGSTTATFTGSIIPKHTEARSPGPWSSTCLLHKHLGQ